MQTTELQAMNWILIPPNGSLAINRYPLHFIPPEGRIATSYELLAANRGHPFPWGSLPEPHQDNFQWRDHSIGVGGLVHKRWFKTREGRFGGASNVTNRLPGSLRCCMYLSGGGREEDALADNEGFAVVRKTSAEDMELYRRLQLYACRFVSADGGALIASPIQADGKVYVGFVGRCQICPNLELVSFPQLKSTINDYDFDLWPEWRRWSLSAVATKSSLSTT